MLRSLLGSDADSSDDEGTLGSCRTTSVCDEGNVGEGEPVPNAPRGSTIDELLGVVGGPFARGAVIGVVGEPFAT